MSDSLRTRIAAVIRREVPCHPPAADRIADAVIRELCLHREEMSEWAVLAEGFRGHRYTTHWEPNDE